jgi:hypothetical protein
MKDLLSFFVVFSLLTCGCVATRLTTGYDINNPSASTTRNIPRVKPASSPPLGETKTAAVGASYSDELFPDRF